MESKMHENGKVRSSATGLIIGKQQTSLLSKQQQAFNKLVKKIEKLRLELVQVNKSLDEKLDFYQKHIYPLEQQLTELNIETTKLLYRFFKDKKLLSKKEKMTVGQIIAARLNGIFQFKNGEPEDELKEIFKAVQGISYEEAAEEDFRNMKNEMEGMFEQFGFEMNFDDLHSKMTQEEIIKKAMEMQEKFKQQAADKDKDQNKRKKTKKQQEKEERERQLEEARTKNIGSIYKQLAKIFHPDLEQNEDQKQQKEELMKKLTIAYENKDLHTLLSLELAWIQKEENNPDKLTDDKLSIYNEVLKEQVYELEEEINQTLQHPRYESLQRFVMFPHQMKNLNMDRQKQEIEAVKNDMTIMVDKLKGNEKQILAAVRELIGEFELETQFNMAFSKFPG
jgi:hypothetical protein